MSKAVVLKRLSALGVVPMQYDQLGVRSIEISGNLFPPLGARFESGDLPLLYAALNQDDVFDNCYGRGQHAAEFEGEHLNFEIEAGGAITITAKGSILIGELRQRVSHLISETIKTVGPRRLFLVDRIEVIALVPEEKGRNVGDLIRKKVFTRLKDEHYAHLPGEIGGAALEVAGRTEDYGYKLTLAPYLREDHTLFIEAVLDFPFPDLEDFDPQADLVSEALQRAYDFTVDSTPSFAASILP